MTPDAPKARANCSSTRQSRCSKSSMQKGPSQEKRRHAKQFPGKHGVVSREARSIEDRQPGTRVCEFRHHSVLSSDDTGQIAEESPAIGNLDEAGPPHED